MEEALDLSSDRLLNDNKCGIVKDTLSRTGCTEAYSTVIATDPRVHVGLRPLATWDCGFESHRRALLNVSC